MEKLYLQSYSYTSAYENTLGFKDCLRKTAELGYDGISLLGTVGGLELDEMKELLNETGLEVLQGVTFSNYTETDAFGLSRYLNLEKYNHIFHLDFTRNMEKITDTDYAIEYFGSIGAKYLGLNNCSLLLSDVDSILRLSEYLNYLGKKASAYGMKASWHNHLLEFWPFGEKRALEIMMDNTDPQYVSFELDTSWCASARVRPEDFIRKHSGRIEQIQFREIDEYFGPEQPDFPDGPNFYITRLNENNQIERVPRMGQEADIVFANCAAGKGIIDWKAVKEAGDAQNCPVHYVVERGYSYNTPKDRWQCLKEDHDYYRQLMRK